MPVTLKSKVATISLSTADMKKINDSLRVINVSSTRLLTHYKARKNASINSEDRDLIKILIEQLDELHKLFFAYSSNIKSRTYSSAKNFLDIEPTIILLNEMWITIKNKKDINVQVINSFKEIVDKVRQTIFASLPQISNNLWD